MPNILIRHIRQSLTLTQMSRQLFNEEGTLIADPLPCLKSINPTIECIERFQPLIIKVS